MHKYVLVCMPHQVYLYIFQWFSAESPKMKEELREKREKKLMAVLASHKSEGILRLPLFSLLKLRVL